MTFETESPGAAAGVAGGSGSIGFNLPTGLYFDDEGDFTQLLAFMQSSREVIQAALDELAAGDIIDADLRSTIPGAKLAVDARVDEVIAAIRGDTPDTFDRNLLYEHGLNDSSSEWAFKYAAFRFALARWREAADSSGLAARGNPGPKPKRLWKRFSWVLKKVNVILKSLAAALVPGAGALSEMKDGTESLVDIAADEIPD